MLESTGLRRAALLHDMAAAIMRLEISNDIRELDELDNEQVAMWLHAIKAQPGDNAWNYAKARGVEPVSSLNA
jgi:hypothetical protein